MEYIVIGICFILSILWILIVAFWGFELWNIVEFLCDKIQKRVDFDITDILYICLSEIIEIIIQIGMVIFIKKNICDILINWSATIFIITGIICAIELFIIFLVCTDRL